MAAVRVLAHIPVRCYPVLITSNHHATASYRHFHATFLHFHQFGWLQASDMQRAICLHQDVPAASETSWFLYTDQGIKTNMLVRRFVGTICRATGDLQISWISLDSGRCYRACVGPTTVGPRSGSHVSIWIPISLNFLEESFVERVLRRHHWEPNLVEKQDFMELSCSKYQYVSSKLSRNKLKKTEDQILSH